MHEALYHIIFFMVSLFVPYHKTLHWVSNTAVFQFDFLQRVKNVIELENPFIII